MATTFTNLLYHIVFSTKNRLPLITKEIQDDLYNYIGGIIRGEGGTLLEIGGVTDHVHLLVKLKPRISISDIMQKIKEHSSTFVNKELRLTRKFGWQDGYAAFTVSESVAPQVRKYIHEHHRTKSFQEELLALLEKHKIEYDLQYVFD